MEVKLEVNDGIELCVDIDGVGAISYRCNGCDEVDELGVIDTSKVGSTGSLEYGISDITANFIGDGFGGSFFGTADGLDDEA